MKPEMNTNSIVSLRAIVCVGTIDWWSNGVVYASKCQQYWWFCCVLTNIFALGTEIWPLSRCRCLIIRLKCRWTPTCNKSLKGRSQSHDCPSQWFCCMSTIPWHSTLSRLCYVILREGCCYELACCQCAIFEWGDHVIFRWTLKLLHFDAASYDSPLQ